MGNLRPQLATHNSQLTTRNSQLAARNSPLAPRSSIVVGIDGGGTKTVAVVVDEDRRVLGRAQAGSTNWNSVGLEPARANLARVVTEALAAAGCTRAAVSALCLGSSGVGRSADRARMTTWLQEMVPGVPVAVHNDAVVALAGGTGGHVYGVVLISGTGMIVYGCDRAGHSHRAGGWGALLGDGGSGYALGMAVLRAVTWAADGRAPATALTAAVLAHLRLEKPKDLIDWAYADYAWGRFAALAPVAVRCAQAGDAVAGHILDEGATALTVAVEAVVEALALRNDAFPLVLSGGMLRPGPYADRVVQKLRTVAPGAELIHPQVEPAVGAALLALQLTQHDEGI